MKPASYIADLHTYDLRGNPSEYDYATAAAVYNEIYRLNARMRYHEASLNETTAGTLILTADRNETPAKHQGVVWIEEQFAARELQRIADEYGFFELPRRYLIGEPELNEIISIA